MQPSAQKAELAREELERAIASIANNHSFKVFVEHLRFMREQAVTDAVQAGRRGDVSASQSDLGAIQAYADILDLIGEYSGEARVLD
jgi:hypothetical protein